MKIPIYQVDSFATQLFKGNPAAVCPLESWLPDDVMQAIAAENNLAETAFFVANDDGYHIRWFAPENEVDLCGHATLASAFIIFTHLQRDLTTIHFSSKSGTLIVKRDGEYIVMDFPAHPVSACDDTPQLLIDGLGITPKALLTSEKYYLVVYSLEADIQNLKPNQLMLQGLPKGCVLVTAKSDSVDFVSRFFIPNTNKFEDPVTGSAHCVLAPYWAKQLHKTKLHAKQLSTRGGEIFCDVKSDRVLLKGQVVEYSRGFIYLT